MKKPNYFGHSPLTDNSRTTPTAVLVGLLCWIHSVMIIVTVNEIIYVFSVHMWQPFFRPPKYYMYVHQQNSKSLQTCTLKFPSNSTEVRAGVWKICIWKLINPFSKTCLFLNLKEKNAIFDCYLQTCLAGYLTYSVSHQAFLPENISDKKILNK